MVYGKEVVVGCDHRPVHWTLIPLIWNQLQRLW